MKEKKKYIAAYKLIKEDIIADILNGIYAQGDQIQGQNYYADKFQVSRTTVRNAIEDLVMRGVLETRKGKGTFVKKEQTGFTEAQKLYQPDPEVPKRKPSPTFHVVSIAIEQADHRIARQMNLNEGDPVVCMKRVRMVNEIAGNYQISYMSKKLVEDIDFEAEDMGKSSLYQLLIDKAHLVPSYSDETIRAVSCPESIAQYFYINTGDPILLIYRVTYSLDGAVMEYCLDYECTDVNGLRIRR